MSKPTSYIASFEGATFTRSSKRTYTHAVLCRRSLAEDRANLEQSVRWNWKQNRAYYASLVDGTCSLFVEFDYSEEKRAKSAADGAAWLAGGLERHLSEALGAFDARVAGRPDRYLVCEGWCGRPDLAQKLAASVGGIVVPAVVL